MGKKGKLDIILENITIESVAAEGKAIAHTEDGRVVFVEFAVPGDVVDIRITRKKKSFMEGRIVRIVKPSADRLEPFCSHFGICGGCRWQPLPYEIQLAAKQRQVYDQLTRIGHLSLPEISPILGSDKTEFYRNKLEFTASNRRWITQEEVDEGNELTEIPGLGFHVGKFFDKVLDIEKCYLQKEPSNAIRLFIKDYAVKHSIPFYNIRENSGVLRNMFIRTTEDDQVMLIVCFAEEFDGREAMLDAISEAFPQITSLYYIINGKVNDSIGDQECILYKGDEAIYETMEGLRFRIGPKSFYQTNAGQAYKLYKVTRDFAGLTGNEIVYDLYTGTGTIAQFVSGKASKVFGIEYVPEAIEDAKVNARANGIDNCEFFAGDMKDILTDEFIAAHGRPDVIILDPPRAGIHPDVAKVILNAAAKRLVYVSCNPASQARDLEILCSKYRITAVQPVDMFPHTQHVENVCALELIEGC
ncbi:MAG: 23S rRNA (uracil(1939)-C(5))-methyltransferase RlmD [Bacteroidales bacterium]|nr:23S rRNA (uracil(1939)-C(5))-methyltransferase RlmD [Candidatus Cryptobacteroides equifaecalis]